MPLKLLKFPYLVLSDIIKNLSYSEALMLSLSNSRLCKFISTMRHGKIKKIRYTFEDNHIYVDIVEMDDTDQVLVNIESVPWSTDIKKTDACKMETFFGVNTLIEYREDDFHIAYPESSEEEFQNALIRQVHTLLGESVPVDIYVENEERLKSLPCIKHVKGSRLSGTRTEGTFLDAFFEKYPNQKSAIIESSWTGKLKENSKLFQVPSLCLLEADTSTLEILQSFDGKHLELRGGICDTTAIAQFLEMWVSGEAYHNLQTLRVILSQTTVIFENWTHIPEKFGAAKWNPNKRPWRYSFDHGTIDFLDTTEIFDCDRFLDIERPHDGKFFCLLAFWRRLTRRNLVKRRISNIFLFLTLLFVRYFLTIFQYRQANRVHMNRVLGAQIHLYCS